MDDLPLLTMTKARVIDDIPEMDDKSLMLYQTLSGLCSFHTAADLASFLFSQNFQRLVGVGDSWVVFEIGIYKEHTIVIEAIPQNGQIIFADASMNNTIPNNLVEISDELKCSEIIHQWYTASVNE